MRSPRPPRPLGAVALVGGVGVACAVIGCAADSRLGRLEHLLRDREDRVASLEARLRSAERELSLTRRQNDDLRAELTGGVGGPVLAAEQADALYRAERLAVVKVLSGGVDLDDRPGHDAAVVQLVPVDADGEPVKLPGDLAVELRDPSGNLVAAESIAAADLRDRWQTGPLASGFHVRLPFEASPSGEKLIATATLTTADGRRLETVETLAVEPGGLTTFAEAAGDGPEAVPELDTPYPPVAPVPEPFEPFEPLAAGDASIE